jgi:hypothetical protein
VRAPHHADVRNASTAERFGVRRLGAPSPAPLPEADSETPWARRARLAAAAPTAEDPAPTTVRTFSPLRERPLRSRARPAPEATSTARPAPEADFDSDSDLEQGWAAEPDDEFGAHDPITAPVPAVDLLGPVESFGDFEGGDFEGGDFEGGDFEGFEVIEDEPRMGRDQVLIRTGQAGTPKEPSGGRGSGKGRPAPEDRPARSGRMKLRRRSQDSP